MTDESEDPISATIDDYEESSFDENNILLQPETQGESSTSSNHFGKNIYLRAADSAKPTREPTIKWDTVLRAAEMAEFDSTYGNILFDFMLILLFINFH